ncbi:unnamed protein product [Cylicocyclus nassatus]|uniref:Uncharacterized protein n=1 Tax=Cylicocyclus nassatus TaxID=53992 RepID=A0AA36H6W5_CYLNA|nr:unnamed protein product [Cylicocyclus nassatus]
MSQYTLVNGTYSYNCRQEDNLFYYHRYFLVGRPAANIALAVEAFLLALFWLCTCLMRREFTIIFTSITMLPMTVKTGLTAFHTAVIHAIDFPSMKVVEALHTAESILETTICFTYLTGTIFFTCLVVHISRVKRSSQNITVISILYISVLLFICALATVDVFPLNLYIFDYPITTFLFFILLIGSGLLVVLLLFAILATGIAEACYCKKRAIINTCDPVVYNSLSRMFWAIPLMISSIIAALIDFAGKISPEPYVFTIEAALLPSCILLAHFLLLPAYRTAIFCCCANNRLQNRIIPVLVPPPRPPSAPVLVDHSLTPVVK